MGGGIFCQNCYETMTILFSEAAPIVHSIFGSCSVSHNLSARWSSTTSQKFHRQELTRTSLIGCRVRGGGGEKATGEGRTRSAEIANLAPYLIKTCLQRIWLKLVHNNVCLKLFVLHVFFHIDVKTLHVVGVWGGVNHTAQKSKKKFFTRFALRVGRRPSDF